MSGWDGPYERRAITLIDRWLPESDEHLTGEALRQARLLIGMSMTVVIWGPLYAMV